MQTGSTHETCRIRTLDKRTQNQSAKIYHVMTTHSLNCITNENEIMNIFSGNDVSQFAHIKGLIFVYPLITSQYVIPSTIYDQVFFS